MRIAYVCADRGVPVFGRKGASIHVQELVRAFRGLGHSVDVLAARTGGTPPPDLRDVGVTTLDEDSGAGDVLDGAEPCDLVYERYSLWSAPGMRFARERGIPGVLEVNAPLIEEAERFRGPIDRVRAERVAREAFSSASAVVAVSAEVASWVERMSPSRTDIHVIGNAVDPKRFAAVRPRPGRDTFTVGFLGTLKPWHGVDTLVRALAPLVVADPSWRLLVVGDGPERSSLEADVRRRGIEASVTFTGAVGHDEVPELLARMDVGVAPYPELPAFYFSPLKVVEYMAAGLPVVASRLGALEELVVHGETGVLCPPGDPAALMAALSSLRARPEERLRLGRSARTRALQHTWEDVARQIVALAVAPETPTSRVAHA